jgi:transcription initiation factor TFIIIB Brf1 subunit/transcription initiation factor TFIIB
MNIPLQQSFKMYQKFGVEITELSTREQIKHTTDLIVQAGFDQYSEVNNIEALPKFCKYLGLIIDAESYLLEHYKYEPVDRSEIKKILGPYQSFINN